MDWIESLILLTSKKGYEILRDQFQRMFKSNYNSKTVFMTIRKLHDIFLSKFNNRLI